MSSVRAILVGTLLVALVASAAAACDAAVRNRKFVSGACTDCLTTPDPTSKANYSPLGNAQAVCGCPSYYRNEDGSGALKCGPCNVGYTSHSSVTTGPVTLTDTSTGSADANDNYLCTQCSNSQVCSRASAAEGSFGTGAEAPVSCSTLERNDNTVATNKGKLCGTCKIGRKAPTSGGDIDSGAEECPACGTPGSICRDPNVATKGGAPVACAGDAGLRRAVGGTDDGKTCGACELGFAPPAGETAADGYRKCVTCPDGSMCRDTSAATSTKGAAPVACSSLNRNGLTNANKGQNCGPCKTGFYFKKATGTGANVLGGAEGYEACTACPAGKSTPSTGAECTGDPNCGATEPNTLCSVTCTAGTQYSNGTTGACENCSTFNRLGNTPATGTCGTCTNDFFSTESSGINYCTACSSVNRGPEAGSSCGSCVVGYYSAILSGTSGCVSCASLNRTAGTTANSCSTCSLGFTGSNDTTTACSSCASLNRVNGPNGGCGVCSAGFVGPASTSVACVTDASYNATCASQNRVPSSGAYPLCGVCVAGAAGVGNGTAACTVCSGNTYPAPGLTTCQSCTSAASATGPACTSCNTATGACLSCPPNSVPTNTTGCTYSCAVGTAPLPGTLTPCSSCLVNNCTSCSNSNGVCLACPTGSSILPNPFAGCIQNAVSTGNSASTNSTQSTAVATATADVLNTFAATATAGSSTQVFFSGDTLAYIGAVVNGSTTESRNVTATITVNGVVVNVTITLAPSADGSGVTVLAAVAYPPLFSGQQLSDLVVSSASVTVRAVATPTTGASKFRRLSASTMAVPGGSKITLSLTGAVGSGRVVYCARVAPGETAYLTYAPAVAAGSNQYTCDLNQPEGSTYALVTIPAPPVGSTGTNQQAVPATYENSHTAVGLGVGLGVGIPVLAAILITIFCCINGGRPKAVAAPAPVYGYGVPAPAVTYASPY